MRGTVRGSASFQVWGWSVIELYLSDIQFPYQEQEAFDITLEIAKDISPDIVFLGGDILDFYQLSDFSKDPQRRFKLQKDLDVAYRELHRLWKVTPAARKIWQDGNHEDRLARFLWTKAPELASLRQMALPEIMDFKIFEIEWIPRDLDCTIGELHHIHGDEFAKGGDHPAKKTMLRSPGNFIFGHHHKAEEFYYRLQNGTVYVSWANGCLCTLNPEYVKKPQWIQSISVVEYTRRGTFHITRVPFFRHEGQLQAILGGKTYKLPTKKPKNKKVRLRDLDSPAFLKR